MFRERHLDGTGEQVNGMREGCVCVRGCISRGAETERVRLAADFNATGKRERFAAGGLPGKAEDGVNVCGAELAGMWFYFFDE